MLDFKPLFPSNQIQTLRCGDRLLDLSHPQVMGILNCTPDSFYDGGRYTSVETLVARAAQMLEEGAAILDIGGVSTRPGAMPIDADAERYRVIPVIEAIAKAFPDALLSIDTTCAAVARSAVEAGAHIVNDVSAGRWDADLLPTVAVLKVPYVLMHAQGKPDTMQAAPHYEDVLRAVADFFSQQLCALHDWGIREIILDPGFGFGKNLQHNYRLLQNLHLYQQWDYPIMVGLSRKSMIYKVLECTPEEALHGTTALHWAALQQGVRLLRVHDVTPAIQTIRLWKTLVAAKDTIIP